MYKKDVLNTVNEQVDILTDAIQSEKLQNYFHDGIWNLIKLILFKDPAAAVEMGMDVKSILFHMPTAMFWAKMERYLKGTFCSYEDQIKLSAKFSEDNKGYKEFVKKHINLINSIELDDKVDYLSNLTRCFFLFDMDVPLYFRLTRFIENCTSDELEFLRDLTYDARLENNAVVSILIIQGLIIQEQDEQNHTHYVLSSFGRLLKKCALNFREDGCVINGSLKYKDIAGIPQMEPVASEDIDDLISQI